MQPSGDNNPSFLPNQTLLIFTINLSHFHHPLLFFLQDNHRVNQHNNQVHSHHDSPAFNQVPNQRCSLQVIIALPSFPPSHFLFQTNPCSFSFIVFSLRQRTTIASTNTTTIITAISTANRSTEFSTERAASQSSVLSTFPPALAGPVGTPFRAAYSQTHCREHRA